jgi:amino acid transporter
MVFVSLAYGGWSDTATLSSEMRDPHRGMTRALLLGMSAVGALYLLANWAYLRGLGLDGLAHSAAPAADLMRRAFGPAGEVLIVAAVATTSISVMNALLIAGARTTYAAARDLAAATAAAATVTATTAVTAAATTTATRTAAASATVTTTTTATATATPTAAAIRADGGVDGIAHLGSWNAQRGGPATAIVAMGVVALLLVGLGTWTRRGFETMVDYLSPVYWLFLVCSGAALIVLRRRRPQAARPFLTPLYPALPLLFCASSAYVLYASVAYVQVGALVSLGVLAAGAAVLAWLHRRGGVRR